MANFLDVVTIRDGRKEDCPVMAEFLRDLGDYVGALDVKTATVHELEESGFGENPWFETRIAEINEGPDCKKIVGLILYNPGFSMFRKRGFHIEALFVHPNFRNRGIGLLLIKEVAKKAVANGCLSLELEASALNTNAIRMYERHGIINHLKKNNIDIVCLRADEKALEKLAA